jgi:amino acid permease
LPERGAADRDKGSGDPAMRNVRRMRMLLIILSFVCFFGFSKAYGEGEYLLAIGLILAAILLLFLGRRLYK